MDQVKGASSAQPVPCGLRWSRNSSFNIEPLWSRTYWCISFPQP